MNKKPNVCQYERFIKSYVAIYKGTKQVNCMFSMKFIFNFFFFRPAYAQGNEKWRNLKILRDHEKIEKEIDRMILEYKSKQSQALFTVWGRQSAANQISVATRLITDITPYSASRVHDNAASNASTSLQSSKPNKVDNFTLTHLVLNLLL